jgi:hypothetical protein
LFVSNPSSDTVTVISDTAPLSSSSTKSSSSSLSSSYLVMVAVDVALVGIAGGLAAKKQRDRSTLPAQGGPVQDGS